MLLLPVWPKRKGEKLLKNPLMRFPHALENVKKQIGNELTQ